MGTPETLARRERRRRQAVRDFLLDALYKLDGVEYVAKDAREGGKDATGTPREASPGSECAHCAGKGYTVIPDGDGCFVKESCECGWRDA